MRILNQKEKNLSKSKTIPYPMILKKLFKIFECVLAEIIAKAIMTFCV